MKKLVCIFTVLFLSYATNTFAICAWLNSGGNYSSLDKKMTAELWHNSSWGPGVSGGISFDDAGIKKESVIKDSTCRGNHLILNWQSPNFKGHLEGTVLNGRPVKIVDIHGSIDGKPISGYVLDCVHPRCGWLRSNPATDNQEN